jgi:[acyl-carrier-protein] S-malonyltransferase
LTRQLVEPVLFSDCLLDMAATGIDTFLHVGPGDVTAGLARRTVEGAQVLAVSGLEDIRSAVDAVVSIDRP